MLLVVGAESAVVRAAFFHLRREFNRNRARLVEFRRTRVGLGVTVDQTFEQAMIRAPLAHIDLVVADQDMPINYAAAFGQMLRVNS